MTPRLLPAIAQFAFAPFFLLAIWLQLPFYWWALCFFMFFVYGSIGIAAGHHRYWSHKAFRTNKPIAWFMAVAGSLGSLLSPLAWAIQHQKHHKFNDTEGDPHSPVLFGWKMLFYAFHKDAEPSLNGVRQIIVDPVCRFINNNFKLLLLIWIDVLFLINPTLLLMMWIVPCWFAINASILAVIIHKDIPFPLYPVFALLSFGETLNHDEHHKNSKIWNNSDRGFDITSWWIRLVKSK